MVEVGRDLQRPPSPTPCLQDHLGHVTQAGNQVDFEYL